MWRATLDDEVERLAVAAAKEQVRSEALLQAVADEFAREEPAREEAARLRPVEST